MYDLSNMAIVVYLDVKFQAGKFLKKISGKNYLQYPSSEANKNLWKQSDQNELSHEKKYFPLYWLVNRDPCNGLL